jgi:signal recognition particle subunit SRP54
MFELLINNLQNIFKKLSGKGKLTEENIQEAIREIRIALLSSDVNYKVVKDFLEKVKEKAIGQELMESLTPYKQFIKIVRDEMLSLFGEREDIKISSSGITKIMLVGIQGCGKTTTCAKLGYYFKKQGKNVALVPLDVYRPAAKEQLKILGKQIDVKVYENGNDLFSLVEKSISESKNSGINFLIFDTAGRLHIDDEMMKELILLKEKINPEEILLVVDSMTGQDAVNQAIEFNKVLNLTGLILTKLDGDARGGAAFSIRAVTGCPIKFVGVGEKIKDLEAFNPERLVSRILGMDDVLGFIEKIEENMDLNKIREVGEHIKKGEFTLEDLREQIREMRKIGPLDKLLEMLPGIGKFIKIKDSEIEEKELKVMEAIINSMTKEERRNPRIIDYSRKRRIARGSGTTVQDVNILLKNYEFLRKNIKNIKKFGLGSFLNLHT